MNHLERKKSRLPLLVCFALPFTLALLIFFIGGLWPIGDRQILAHDGWHQYYPFFAAFREKLLSGGSLQYTWDVGMGVGYLSLYAYYLACPLNFLSVLVPASLLREYFALLTILKLALSGFFFGWYLKLVFRRNDWTLPFFSLLYAFCAFMAGYYWNLMWLDVLAIFPLLVAGTVCLLRDGKFRLYCVSLALSLWCNYYLSFFCCIFVALAFFGYCICRPNGFAGFFRRLARISLCTLLAVGVTAVLLLPTLYGLRNTYSAASEFPKLLAMNIAENGSGTVIGSVWETIKSDTLPGFLSASRQVLAGLLVSSEPTKMEGLPNVFCGISTVTLALYYLCCKHISVREKLVSLGLLFFFLVSFIFRVLDYVWHGFHFPNMLPYRFSFLFSFVLISMAFRAYTQLRFFKKRYFFVIVPLALALIACGWGLTDGWRRMALSLAVFVAACVVLAIYSPFHPRRTTAAAILVCMFSAEAVCSFGMGVGKVALTTRSSYPKENNDVQAVLAEMRKRESDLFYRAEVNTTQTLNDGALNGYHGVTAFTSSANVRFNRFTRSLGLASWPASNRYAYYESAPFTDLMCGIKYLIDRDGKQLDRTYSALTAQSGDVLLLERTGYVGVGFLAKSGLQDFVIEENRYNPITEQEELFRLATGVEDALYEHLAHDGLDAPEGCSIKATGTSGTQYSYSTIGQTDTVRMSVSYTMPRDGVLCATTKSNGNNDVDIYRNGELLYSPNIKVRFLMSLGSVQAGDVITFSYPIKKAENGTISLDVVLQNDAVFEEGRTYLAQGAWTLTHFSDTELSGTVTASEDGFFYTSVPYEPGWRAYVDGVETELAPNLDPNSKDLQLTDAVCAFPLSAGTHEITLKYTAPGLKTGAVISLVCLAALTALFIGLRRRPVLFPDPKRLRPQTDNQTLEGTAAAAAELSVPTERNDPNE